MGCSSSSGGGSFDNGPPKKVDPRLPFRTYRQLFNLKNSWKAVTRNLEDVAIDNLIRFFKKHPEYLDMHSDLKNLKDDQAMRESTTFENRAVEIFNVFDEFMETIESDLDGAIQRLQRVGKIHSNIDGFKPEMFKDMESSFMDSVKETLGDRFTEPTEENFRNLYEFVTKQMTDGC